MLQLLVLSLGNLFLSTELPEHQQRTVTKTLEEAVLCLVTVLSQAFSNSQVQVENLYFPHLLHLELLHYVSKLTNMSSYKKCPFSQDFFDLQFCHGGPAAWNKGNLWHILQLLLHIQPTQGSTKQSLGPLLHDIHSHAVCQTRKELAKQKKYIREKPFQS